MTNYTLKPSELKSMMEQQGYADHADLMRDLMQRDLMQRNSTDSDLNTLEDAHAALSVITDLLEDFPSHFEQDSGPVSPSSSFSGSSIPPMGPVTPAAQVLPTNNMRWSAGQVRFWTQSLNIAPCSSPRLDVEAEGDSELELEAEYGDGHRVSPSNTSATKKVVRAIFYRSFLDSVMSSHDRVAQLLEAGVVMSQTSKYRRQTKRVSDAMHKYYTHYFLCPHKSFREALQSFPVAAPTSEFKSQLTLVTEEVPPMTEFHTFDARTVSVEEAARLQNEGVLVLTGDYWKFMGQDHTYYDYFLVYDEQKYTTFLDFIARLHIITSSNHLAVTADDRMLVADSLALMYSPYDSVSDMPALERRVGLMDFLNNRPDLVKALELEPIAITWQNRSLSTYLATPFALRRVLIALEQQCIERSLAATNEETKIVESNWGVRVRNYLTYQFPALCQGSLAAPFARDIPRPLEFSDIQIITKTKLRPRPKRVVVGMEKLNLDGLQKDEYVICSMSFMLCSAQCGCQRTQFEPLHMEFPIRVALLPVARSLQIAIEDLFQDNLPLIQLGRDGISRASLPMFRAANKILSALSQLGLVAPENFDQDNQAIVHMGKIEFPVMPLVPIMRSRAPLTRLHHYLKNNERRMERVAAEVIAGRLTALSIACCATSILHEAEKREGLRESVLTFNVFGESMLGVADASMVVNVVLRTLDTASFQLLSAVLGTAEESFVDSRIAPELAAAANLHPMILASHPGAISGVSCGCVVCIAVATTRSGTWNRSLLRPKLLRSEARLTLPSWENGVVKLLCKMVLPQRAFIAQRSFSYILHNAPESSSSSEPDISPRPGPSSALDLDETRNEWLTAMWDSKNDAAASRVRSAMIIGAQATGVLATKIFSPNLPSTICRARFLWPGWLCSLICKEAQGQVPKGTSHWAATQAIWITPLSEIATQRDEREACGSAQSSPRSGSSSSRRENSGEEVIYIHANTSSSHESSSIPSTISVDTSASLASVLPSTGPRNKKQILQGKSKVCQPHPVYSWPLERLPAEDEIVLIDLAEQKRVCLTIAAIAEMKSPPVFVSHVWETPWHPDPCGRQMGTAVQKCESYRYLWVDYVSLPQGDKNDAEKLRFRKTLMNLQALQSRMKTIAPDDEYDRTEWQRRGWCIVEAIVGDLPSPLAQAVTTEFRQHRTLAHVFERLRIRVTNPGDLPILDEILSRHLPVAIQQKPIPKLSGTLLAVVPLSIPPIHLELDMARRARERYAR